MKVLFVCVGGMSSSLAINALKKEGEKRDVQMTVYACGTSEFESKLKEGWDLVMIAPQVRYMFTKFKSLTDAQEIPCEMIPPMLYTPLGGPGMFELTKKLVK